MDKAYWNTFYNNNSTLASLNNCSAFCLFVMDYISDIPSIKTVLDAGCGNGRDSYMLCTRYDVVGVDNNGFIPSLEGSDISTLQFSNCDFVSCDKENFDMVYSRFTLHSISDQDHIAFIRSIRPASYLCIEMRSSLDADKTHHHGDSHYRNYVDLGSFVKLLTDNNYEILYVKEGQGMAIYKDENPVCIRIICRKQDL